MLLVELIDKVEGAALLLPSDAVGSVQVEDRGGTASDDRALKRGRQVRVGKEGLQMAWAAGHEQENSALGRGSPVRLLRSERIERRRSVGTGGQQALLAEHGREREHAETAAGVAQEVAARVGLGI